jgi:hypothetical protein
LKFAAKFLVPVLNDLQLHLQIHQIHCLS